MSTRVFTQASLFPSFDKCDLHTYAHVLAVCALFGQRSRPAQLICFLSEWDTNTMIKSRRSQTLIHTEIFLQNTNSD
jgi:hypothetical protein